MSMLLTTVHVYSGCELVVLWITNGYAMTQTINCFNADSPSNDIQSKSNYEEINPKLITDEHHFERLLMNQIIRPVCLIYQIS